MNVGALLIEKGADVNFKARNNITPLHVSSKWGRAAMVTLLLDSKADIASCTRDGLTPLHCGARSGHDQVVDLLLECGAPVAEKTKVWHSWEPRSLSIVVLGLFLKQSLNIYK